MYALSMLWVCLGTWALTRALGMGVRPPRRRWWAVYALCVTLGMYTLYLTALVWLSHVMWLLIRSWRHRAEGWRAWRWILAYGAAVVLYLPWMPVLFGQMGDSVLPPVRRSLNMSGLASVYAVTMTGRTDDELPSWCSLVLLAVAVASAVVCIVMRMRGVLYGRRCSGLVLLGMTGLFPVALMAVASAFMEAVNQGYGFFSIRYLSVSALLWYAAIGAMFGCLVDTGRDRDAGRDRDVDRDRDTGQDRDVGRDCGVRMPDAYACESAGRPYVPKTVNVGIRVLYAVTAVILASGAMMFAARGNYNFDTRTTPAASALRAQVTCSRDHPVVAADDYTYIDAHWYYRTCPYYYFLSAEEVPTRGGYAPLRDIPDRRLRDVDELDVDTFTLLTWTSVKDYDRRIDSDRFVRGRVLRDQANIAVEYRRR